MYNPLIKTDSYKLSHYSQYPEGTEHVYSYIEARKGNTPVVVLGISEFVFQIQGTLCEGNVAELKDLATLHGVPFNEEGWSSLLEKYSGQEYPVLIKGVPEGTVVEPGTPVATIVNQDPEFPWLTSFFETLFLRCVWYPSTVASISRAAKVIIRKALEETGDVEGLPFKLHDFGARGVSSGESAALGGMGHLVNFEGTDTLEAIQHVRENFNCEMPGFSIPATEHSTVTSWGREFELNMYRSFALNNLSTEGSLAACVSDSYNIWDAVDMWALLYSENPWAGTLVVRPDSGDPITTPVQVIEALMDVFGYSWNDKGYKVLPDHVRVLQGDGITLESIQQIIDLCKDHKISLDNLAFGMGRGLLQHCDRDTYGWAMKCSAARVNSEWRDVYKDPIGGGKASKRGLVTALRTVPYEQADLLILNNRSYPGSQGFTTYYDGVGDYVRRVDSWDLIKERAEVY